MGSTSRARTSIDREPAYHTYPASPSPSPSPPPLHLSFTNKISRPESQGNGLLHITLGGRLHSGLDWTPQGPSPRRDLPERLIGGRPQLSRHDIVSRCVSRFASAPRASLIHSTGGLSLHEPLRRRILARTGEGFGPTTHLALQAFTTPGEFSDRARRIRRPFALYVHRDHNHAGAESSRAYAVHRMANSNLYYFLLPTVMYPLN